MASRFTLPEGPASRFGNTEFARRLALAREVRPEEETGKPRFQTLLGELDMLAEPLRRPFRRKLEIAPARRPRTVMVLPGFGADSRRMRYFAQQIERAGHRTKRWSIGRNWGPTPEKFDALGSRLLDLHARAGEPVVLVGWSLGGVFAREIAKRHPHSVAKVITMGSPFSGSPRANNVWRIYQLITGHRVDAPPIKTDRAAKPPVETVALWSPNDGAIGASCAAGLPGERDRAIALRCTHVGFTYAPEAISTVLAELDR